MVTHSAKEIGDLAMAERHITDGKERVRRQAELIEELRRNGRDASEAEEQLAAMQDALKTWGEHQRHVLSALAETD
jgi:hypothetical protein